MLLRKRKKIQSKIIFASLNFQEELLDIYSFIIFPFPVRIVTPQ